MAKEEDEKRESKLAHGEYYNTASRYAHPMATGVMPLLFGYSGDAFGPRLYPEFNAAQFKEVARQITAESVFVAYTARNAAADIGTISSDWLKRLAQMHEKVTGEYPEHIQRDWEEHDRRHDLLVGKVRPACELDAALDSDPNSVRNLRRQWQ